MSPGISERRLKIWAEFSDCIRTGSAKKVKTLFDLILGGDDMEW